jgi:hypothetical protein
METTYTPEVTSQQKQFALEYLNRTRLEFLSAIANLSEEQWRFKAGANCWSIAENAEHLAIVENRVGANLDRMPDAAAAEPGRDDEVIDQHVCREVEDRTTKQRAPEFIQPSGTWMPSDCVAHFEKGRNDILQRLDKAEYLRGHVIPHPLLGPWDGFQWILAVSAHTARHTAQIREVKSDPNFPRD